MLGEEFTSGVVLTPADFLSLNTTTGPPHLNTEDNDPEYTDKTTSADELLSLWRKGLSHIDRFWKIWSDEYLLSLQECYQQNHRSPRVKSAIQPTVSEVVLLKENSPRGTWKLAVITELIPSEDGNVRSARVCTQSGHILHRAIHMLYPLEIGSTPHTEPHSEISEPKDDIDWSINYEHRDDNKRKKMENIDCDEHKQTCPKRKAAIKAQKLIYQWMNT